MLGENGALRINGEKYSKLFVTQPDMESASVAFFDGDDAPQASDIEARMWIAHILDDSKPLITKPEQAIVVTKILEAIYTSAESGKAVYFD